MQCSFSTFRYSCVKQRASFNVGVAFLILFLFFSKSFSLVTSYYASGPGACTGGSASMACSFNRNNGACSAGSPAPSLPPGSTFSDALVVGYASGGCGDECSATGINSASCRALSPTITDGRPVTWFIRCQCFFSVISNNGSLSFCSDPVPIPAPQCNGGNGLFMRGSSQVLAFKLEDMFGVPNYENMGNFWYYTWDNGSQTATSNISPPGAENNPSTLPDGSQCNNFNQGDGQLTDLLICPLGHESPPDPPSSSSSEEPSSSSSEPPASSSSSEQGGQSSSGGGSPDLCTEFPTLPYCECQRNPSLPWCSNAGSSNSNNGGQSSNSSFDLCTDFPHLIFCQSSDSGGGSSGGSNGGTSSASSGGTNDGGINFGGGNGGEGNATCLANNNCNWARIDVQLNQLGVETQTRDIVANIASLQQAGYNLTNEQNILLHSVLQAVNSGNADIVGAINGLASAVNSASSANNDNFNSQLSTWQDMMNKIFGSGSGDGSGDGEGDGSGSCEGDNCVPGGLGVGDTSGFSGKANRMISGGGKGFAPYTESQISALIPSKISSGQCPVIDKQLSFFGTSIPFHIDFNHLVKGSDFDWAKFMKACLLITVYFINTFSMIAIFRSGGHK